MQPDRDAKGGIPTLVFWLLAQAVCLTAAHLDLALTGQGLPARPNALPLLYSCQLLLSAALFPELLATLRRSLLIAATAFLALQLAGHIAQQSTTESLLAFLRVLLWLAALTCWRSIARGHTTQLLSCALLAWVTGFPLLAYLLRDFAPNPAIEQLLNTASPLLSSSIRPLLANLLLALTTCILLHLTSRSKREART